MIDSTTKLRDDFRPNIDIYTVPVRVFINDQEFDDTEEITDKILEALNRGEKVETSLPRVDLVEDLLGRLRKEYDVVYVLSISSLLSGTYNLFYTIANKYENVFVFDSKTVSIQNTYVLERMVNDISLGKKIEEDDIISYRDDSLFLISVFDVTQLQRSGRIGKVTSLIGKMMHIKPILTIARNGEVQLVQKAIGIKKVKDIIREKVQEFVEKARQKNRGIRVYGAVGTEEYKDFVYEVAQMYDVKPYFVDIGPAVTTHVGTEGFGILVGLDF
ncbi:EDD domain protein, DegV family [Fervidobacterium changbaicum]|uniref:DegV family EDD domain-containing protein n=1 Tax=Fervidobacterium islandicum TaxID=2423 RepID=A0AAI8CL95_FERIS|nr:MULTISPECIES: DegV family protein [Fervidobacterium]AMW32452.2 DegV family EDD domain-containing protein [Fervidobacterium islandicum]SDH25145.1 EDD domain protein, DegV family [Fervidobacterium changbaicum]